MNFLYLYLSYSSYTQRHVAILSCKSTVGQRTVHIVIVQLYHKTQNFSYSAQPMTSYNSKVYYVNNSMMVKHPLDAH